jgi:hypothetical protein
MEYVNASGMQSLHGWIPACHPMDLVSWSLGLFSKTTFWIGLIENGEIMALRTLTTVDLFYFIMCEDPHEYKFH